MSLQTTGLAPVNDKGDKLFYTDTGPVPDSTDYKTLFLFHGSAFTGHTFHRLIPMAAANNLRLVIVNRRDYPGSTKYTDEELQSLKEGKQEFLEAVGRETLTFLSWYVKNHDIPKLSADRKLGGIVVLGWSLGAATPLAMLAYPETIPKELYDSVEPYLKQAVLYDPPLLAFGYDQPPELYNPFTDPDLKTPEEVFANFGVWVSSYYNHPDLSTRSPKGLDDRKRGPRFTVETMTPEDMEVCFSAESAQRMEFPMFVRASFAFVDSICAEACLNRALWDEKCAQTVFPNLEIVHQVCTASPWYTAWAYFENLRLLEEHKAAGHKVRHIRFIEIPGANHFVHWDDPKAFMDAILEGL
ncbi:alpha/beta-hydrolase [Hymenopellis radicata]|nr:alpha/beta-hydrolase [Hymenopellis radicata]